MSNVCSVEGCGKPKDKKGWCGMHYRRMQRHGTLAPNQREFGQGTVMKSGHISLHIRGRVVYEHVLVAEKALGKRLPKGAQVHHVDLNPANNTPTNLVICPNDAYHKLLHQRQAAMDACGNPNFRKCRHCKQYGPPVDMFIRGTAAAHKECARAYDRQRRPAKVRGSTR